jgi:DNA-binding transcriptional ArsR family regulator
MELAEPFTMSQPAISKHLKVLERAGLVSRGQLMPRRPVKLEAKPMADAAEWLERYRKLWDERFEALDAVLANLQAAKTIRKKKENVR